jgi:NAD(P)-dependent dehydrogenase (short-subunit alcohol dehydrogenase family)
VLASELLRHGLLEGTSVLVAGGAEPSAELGSAVGDACEELGARVRVCALDVVEETVVDELVSAGVAEGADDEERLDMLAVDGAGLFAQGGLRTCLDAAWNITRAVVNLAFLPAGGEGRIVYLAPAPDAGEHADAARAGLENLSRTLSIEWARHGITLVTIALGEDTSASEAASLVAYLASPAGAYFSGCLLDLRGV